MSDYWNPSRFVDENGVPYGVKHIGNRPRVSSTPYLYDIAEGNIADHYPMRKFGHNAAVGAALETVWSGSNIYPYMATKDILEILSDDEEDGGSGTDTGALTMTIYGLDEDYALQNETVTLNGGTIVESSLEYLRVYRAIVNTAGSLGWNKGTITVRDKTNDVARALIDPTFNQTLMAVFTVPAGHTAYIISWYLSSSVSKVVEAGLFIREFGGVFAVKRYVDFLTGPHAQYLDIPHSVSEKSDIEVRASAAGGGGHVAGGFTLWYEAN